MSNLSDYPKIEFLSRGELRHWLKANHKKASAFWLITYKKHVTECYVPYGHVVEELLCYGWIDARTRRLDDDRMMLLVAPRKAGSTWSASNKKRIGSLTKQGLMRPAGQSKVDAAQSDGSWTFLDDVENLVVPEDLAKALNKNKRARNNFESFSVSARKTILLWVKTAKREQTRATRIKETVRLAAMNLKAAHPEARGR